MKKKSTSVSNLCLCDDCVSKKKCRVYNSLLKGGVVVSCRDKVALWGNYSSNSNKEVVK